MISCVVRWTTETQGLLSFKSSTSTDLSDGLRLLPVFLFTIIRSLQFINEFIVQFLTGTDDLLSAANNAYTKTLMNYHGWVIRGAFAVSRPPVCEIEIACVLHRAGLCDLEIVCLSFTELLYVDCFMHTARLNKNWSMNIVNIENHIPSMCCFLYLPFDISYWDLTGWAGERAGERAGWANELAGRLNSRPNPQAGLTEVYWWLDGVTGRLSRQICFADLL